MSAREPRPRQIRVLLIEDTDSHAELVKRHLARAPGRPAMLERVDRLSAGLSLLAAGGIDAVLLDLGLPDCEPSETLDRVLAQAPDTPVVVLTAVDDLDSAVEAVQKGAQDHLVKTQISSELLIRSIRYAIERKRADAAVRESERLLKRGREELRRLNETLERRVAERTATAELRSEQLRQLTIELSTAEHRERRHLAQFLHDHIQQLLVAAKMQLEVTPHSSEQYGTILAKARGLLIEVLSASRSLIFELSPPVLHEQGLAAALAWLARWNQEQFALTVAVDADLVTEPSDAIRGLLFQAIRELLFNVVKHAGVTEAKVQLRLTGDGQVIVVVEDRGQGFDPSIITRQFDHHFGLFSLKERLELIGGRVELDSLPGRGTRAVLHAPLTLRDSDKPAAEPVPPPALKIQDRVKPNNSPHTGRKISVVLADDHQLLREALAGRLAHEPDLEIIGQASDGQMAFDLTKRLVPDVVILDISMPVLSGIEAAKLIKAALPTICILGLSMHSHDDMAKAMRDAGAAGFVNKTAPIQSLIAAIRQHVSSRNGAAPPPRAADKKKEKAVGSGKAT